MRFMLHHYPYHYHQHHQGYHLATYLRYTESHSTSLLFLFSQVKRFCFLISTLTLEITSTFQTINQRRHCIPYFLILSLFSCTFFLSFFLSYLFIFPPLFFNSWNTHSSKSREIQASFSKFNEAIFVVRKVSYKRDTHCIPVANDI